MAKFIVPDYHYQHKTEDDLEEKPTADPYNFKRLFVITGDPAFGQTEKCKQVWKLFDKTCTVLHTDKYALFVFFTFKHF